MQKHPRASYSASYQACHILARCPKRYKYIVATVIICECVCKCVCGSADLSQRKYCKGFHFVFLLCTADNIRTSCHFSILQSLLPSSLSYLFSILRQSLLSCLTPLIYSHEVTVVHAPATITPHEHINVSVGPTQSRAYCVY